MAFMGLTLTEMERRRYDSCLEWWKSVIMKGIGQCMDLKYPSRLPGLECFGKFILDVTDAR